MQLRSMPEAVRDLVVGGPRALSIHDRRVHAIDSEHPDIIAQCILPHHVPMPGFKHQTVGGYVSCR